MQTAQIWQSSAHQVAFPCHLLVASSTAVYTALAFYCSAMTAGLQAAA